MEKQSELTRAGIEWQQPKGNVNTTQMQQKVTQIEQ